MSSPVTVFSSITSAQDSTLGDDEYYNPLAFALGEDEDVLRILQDSEKEQSDQAYLQSLADDESWASFASFGPRCNRCGNPCGHDIVYCDNLAFHKRHFTCKRCNIPLDVATPISGEIFCLKCSKQVHPSTHCCYVCGAPQTPNSVCVSGHVFCPNHFRCASCQRVLTLDNFRQRQGRFYCLEHVPISPIFTCTVCHQEIHEKTIHALGQYYHPQCFVCCQCHKGLANKSYTVMKNHPICTDCFKKLPKHVRLSATASH